MAYAIRGLGAYRGSDKKFSILQMLNHEIQHSAKERSAIYWTQIGDLKYANLNNSYVFLIYKDKNILRKYSGDVWTVRYKYDPYRVVRTKPSNTRRGYDECIVRGKPFAVIAQTANKAELNLINSFCKINHLKLLRSENDL